MRLILVRHPQPEIDAGICYGRADVAASTTDTARVRAMLAGAGVCGAVPLYSSPALRCAVLANQLAAVPHFDARLREMDFGLWELRRWDDIARADIDAWNRDLLHYRPGGGESVLAVAHRVAAFLADLHDKPDKQALIICHAGTIRLLQALRGGRTVPEAALHAARTPNQIGYGEMVILG